MQLDRLSSSEARGRYAMPDARCMAADPPHAPGLCLGNEAALGVEAERGDASQVAEPAQRAALQAELDAPSVRAPQLEAALVLQLLEAIQEPVFVLNAGGRLEQANSRGRCWLRTQEGCDAVLALRAALVAGTEPDGFALTRVHTQAVSEVCLLARFTRGARVLPAVLVERARHSWGLSERSLRVLEQVACGRSNKEIAAALGRSEVTVERHLTYLFRRAGCQSRAELIATLYAL